tara:strand:+ start:235 stop:930 length:696 start_codon:yes stop_codon:yes gene_type:complete
MELYIYDLETTGLGETARIIEICILNVKSKEIFYRKVNPEMHIPEESTKIHGMKDEDVATSPILKDVLVEMIQFCSIPGKDDKYCCLAAHNNFNFDKRILRAEAWRVGITLPKWRYLDTLRLVKNVYPDFTSYKLINLKEHFGIVQGRDHSAKDDVMSLYLLYTIWSKGKTLKECYKISKNYVYTKMPFGKYRGYAFSDIPEDYLDWLKRTMLDEPRHKDLRKALRVAGKL